MSSQSIHRIVLASGNAGKLREFRQVLAPLDVEVIPQSELGVSDAEETGLSFIENAILKARHACRCTGLPALADDSGLEVDALDGAPGIYSARFAGPGARDEENCERLLHQLAEIPQPSRSARFRCVLAFLRHAEDPTPLISIGTWEGQILEAPRGNGGFGYDPLFLVPDLGRCAAELAPEEKNRISHRGQAVTQLVEQIGPYLNRGL